MPGGELVGELGRRCGFAGQQSPYELCPPLLARAPRAGDLALVLDRYLRSEALEQGSLHIQHLTQGLD